MRKLVLSFIIVGLFFLSWLTLVRLLGVQEYLIPDPVVVLTALRDNHSLLISNFIITLIEVILGFLIANTLSVTIGLMITVFKNLEKFVLTTAIILKTIPIIAVTPLLIMWLGPNIAPKVATAALICFFPSLVNIAGGMRSLNRGYDELFRIYNASKISYLKHLYIPYLLPFLFSSLKISSSLAVVGALVGEFLGSNQGLGFVIITNYYSLNTPVVFAAVLLSSLMGIFLYYGIELLEKNIVKWRYE